ncbi:MAG: esterase family protein [Lachnospiraceae bacterium]|nr:esterase family protein [Lachnospiraceae bacterium]
MKETYLKHYSRILGRDMELLAFSRDGDLSEGRLCLAFPPQNGRFYDFGNFGMTEAARPWIDAGRLTVVCADGIDGETWSFRDGDPRARIELQERWFGYVTEELLPEFARPGQRSMVCGCSMGGVHAGNFFFRRPDLFDCMVSLSGLFNAQYFFGDYMDDLVYANSPVHFLPDLPEDHPWMDLYRQGKIILCCGQGAWEADLLAGTRDLDRVLTEKGIPHWADYWGFDVSHDWPWWQKQLPYFLGKLEEEGRL